MSQNNERERDEKIRTYTNAAQAGAAAEVVQRYGSAAKEHFVAFSGADNETGMQIKRGGLKHISESRVHPDNVDRNLRQQAGFSAENKYAARQNAERIINKDESRVCNTDVKGNGGYNETADFVIKDKNGIVISQEQMKFVGSNPKKLLNKLAGKDFQKYLDADAKITIPKDYFEGVEINGQTVSIFTEIDKSISGFQKQLDHARATGNTELAQKLEAQIAKYEKIRASLKNSGITNAEAMEARLHPVLSTAKEVVDLAHQAGMEQAAYGAAIGGSVSLIRNLVAVIKKDKSADEAALSVVKDTGTGAATSYATAFAGTAIKGAMQNAGSETVRTLARTNLAATVVTVAMESGKSLGKYIRGEIDGTECLEELGEKGTGLLSSAMFATAGMSVAKNAVTGMAIAGQTVIPIPVVGAMIGSMVGYALASSCYGELLGALKEAKLAHEERLRVEQECAEAIALIRQYRAELEAAVSQYLSDHISAFTDAFSHMNHAIGLDDIDGFMAGAASIAAKVGGNVQFTNYSEFDSFMQTDGTLKL